MANPDHVDLVHEGVQAWNLWRTSSADVRPDLSGADLREVDLRAVNLGAAQLHRTRFRYSDLSGADFRGAYLERCDLRNCSLLDATFQDAWLFRADFSNSRLCRADLRASNCAVVQFYETDLSDADLRSANLRTATFVGTNVAGADFSGCRIYGIAAWDLRGAPKAQKALVINDDGELAVTADNLQVAQFVHLLLRNPQIREVLDTVTRKLVLILGRFTPDRKAVLDAVRERLQHYDLVPVVVDFDVPAQRNVTETVTLLARLAAFIVADITEPSSLPQELQAFVPTVKVPVCPILQTGHRPWAMFRDLAEYDWVLPPHEYGDLAQLLETLQASVITPAQDKARQIEQQRQRFLAE